MELDTPGLSGDVIAFIRNFPRTKKVQRVIPAHEDLTSMGALYTVPASTITVEVPTTFDDIADALTKAADAESGRGLRENDG